MVLTSPRQTGSEPQGTSWCWRMACRANPLTHQNWMSWHYTSSHKKELKRPKEKKWSFLKGKGGRKDGEKREREGKRNTFSVSLLGLYQKEGYKEFLQNLFLERKDSAGRGWGEAYQWSTVLKHHNSVHFTYKVHISSSLPSNCYDTPRTITDGYIWMPGFIIQGQFLRGISTVAWFCRAHVANEESKKVTSSFFFFMKSRQKMICKWGSVF